MFFLILISFTYYGDGSTEQQLPRGTAGRFLIVVSTGKVLNNEEKLIFNDFSARQGLLTNTSLKESLGKKMQMSKNLEMYRT